LTFSLILSAAPQHFIRARNMLTCLHGAASEVRRSPGMKKPIISRRPEIIRTRA
jgi:hypothetical protein